VKATINGKAHDLPGNLTVAGLLDLFGSPRHGVAVARNERIVRRTEYDTLRLAEGDRVEIIKAVAGG
jgi:sulfur carrier protein